MSKQNQRFTQLCIETIGLSSPRGRLLFFILISLCVFVVPPKWPVTFSVWQYLGIASPSIGLTRAYRHVLHGDLMAAWHQNKLIYVVIVAGGMVLAKDVLTLVSGHTKK